MLSHADRSRVISEDDRKKLFSRQNVFPGTVLVDGFAAGMWRLSRAAGAATLTVELFRPISSRDGEAIAEEGRCLLGFAAAGTAGHDIRIVNLS